MYQTNLSPKINLKLKIAKCIDAVDNTINIFDIVTNEHENIE